MKNKKYFVSLALSICLLANFVGSASATAVLRQGSGANPAAIQALVDQFRADLGGANNGVGGHFKTGRREVNWDAVPDSFSAPNFLPPNFFNINSPRGIVFNTVEFETGSGFNDFIVSADSDNPTATPVRFGNIDASYPTIFQTFSSQRLFVARDTSMMEVNFFVPGTTIPATVNGFGVIFADVDGTSSGNRTRLVCYLANGDQFVSMTAPAANNGLSFAGVSGNAGERISRCVIESGNTRLGTGIEDTGPSQDLVAMDDFIYGEPRAKDYHRGDFDGDGTSDAAVFRPSSGTWFITNSGNGTTDIAQFGQNGDIPVEGDFDGDKLADLAVFRPSEGGWYIRRSSNGTFITQAFGAPGDKPVAGDYDKDGRTDIAIWRPSNGNYFVLRSSDNLASFFAFPFGTNGDIPLLAGPQ